MKKTMGKRAWFCLILLSTSLATFVVGCSNPDGEGLSDQQKLDGAQKARQQQMSGQKAGSSAPMTRESMPGATNSK